jgi:carboxyl-terminal processing protease
MESNQTNSYKKTRNIAILITSIFIIAIVLLLSIATFLITKTNILNKPALGSKTDQCLAYIEKKSIYALPKDKQFATCNDAVKSLEDEYSVYFTKPDYEKFINSVNNTYSGIGIAIDQTKVVEGKTFIGITKVFDKTPAKAAELKEKDLILEVNGVTTENKKTDEVSKNIRGEEGTSVKLKIKSGEIVNDKEIVRKKVEIPTVELTVVDDTAIITISSFTMNLYEEFVTKTNFIKNNNNIKKIVMDLRSNGGGSLESAVDLIGAFTPKNTHALSELLKDEEKKLYTRRDPLFLGKKLIIIGDENTASASEITMISLKEKANATLIGKKTYGKGVVQQLIDLDTGDVIKLTIAEWTSPSGYKINKQGIQPDKEIELVGPAVDPKNIELFKTL